MGSVPKGLRVLIFLLFSSTSEIVLLLKRRRVWGGAVRMVLLSSGPPAELEVKGRQGVNGCSGKECFCFLFTWWRVMCQEEEVTIMLRVWCNFITVVFLPSTHCAYLSTKLQRAPGKHFKAGQDFRLSFLELSALCGNSFSYHSMFCWSS